LRLLGFGGSQIFLAVLASKALDVVRFLFPLQGLGRINSLLAICALGTATSEVGESVRSGLDFLLHEVDLGLLLRQALLLEAGTAVDALFELLCIIRLHFLLARLAFEALGVIRFQLKLQSLSRIDGFTANRARHAATAELRC